MKYIPILLFALSSAVAQQPTTIEEHITRMVELGIDAGINACIVRGVPRNKYALEVNKAHAKALIKAIYPETNWQWSSPQPLDPIKVGKVEGEQVF